MTTSTTSRRSVRLFMRSLLRRTGRGSGPGRRLGRTVMRHIRRHQRQMVKLLIRPAPPTGPGPVTASGQVATRHKASLSGGHTHGHQPTAQHHQAALAILTVIPPPAGRPLMSVSVARFRGLHRLGTAGAAGAVLGSAQFVKAWKPVSRTSRAGTPATIVLGATSRVPTAPAATIAPSPIVTPGTTVAEAPSHTLRPITMGAGVMSA